MIRKNNQSVLYQSFCDAEGSQHIASEYAIGKIKGMVDQFRVKEILEIGLGIGSISGIILAMDRCKYTISYTGTEANHFCLKALQENLKTN